MLSTEYVGHLTLMEFEDAAGRRFLKKPQQVFAGYWSPHESRAPREPEIHLTELRRLAQARGGRLVSAHYISATTKNLSAK